MMIATQRMRNTNRNTTKYSDLAPMEMMGLSIRAEAYEQLMLRLTKQVELSTIMNQESYPGNLESKEGDVIINERVKQWRKELNAANTKWTKIVAEHLILQHIFNIFQILYSLYSNTSLKN